MNGARRERKGKMESLSLAEVRGVRMLSCNCSRGGAGLLLEIFSATGDG